MVKCPHCEEEYDKNEIVIEKISRGLAKSSHWLYSCPRCGKCLGLSQLIY